MNTSIFAGELQDVLRKAAGQAVILSLDCFDTLLWRDTAEPIDVFFALAGTPLAITHGITAQLRVTSEAKARRHKWIRRQSSEVDLLEIYRTALPDAPDALIRELAENELQLEMRHCHAFGPVVDLIRDASARGLKVIIVSDTYFSRSQLRRLILNAEPALEPLIDEYFCSSEHGVSKADGIWGRLLPRLKEHPGRIIHIGDNPVADRDAALRRGLRGYHLVQNDEQVRELLRLRQQFAVQLLPEIRHTQPLPSPYHAQLAAYLPPDSATAFGYTSIGPIMYGFAEFIQATVQRLRAERGTVKVGFLLRDGHLPQLAHEALTGSNPDTSRLSISRFTAIASSFRSAADIHSYLATNLQDDNLAVLAKQLLLPSHMATAFIERAQRSPQPATSFVKALQQAHVVKQVLQASATFRQRLLKHVRSLTGVQRGDTLVFVDLGYNGTAQTRLADVLREELGVELHGCYLLSSQQQRDRCGVIEPGWLDPRAISAMTGSYIAAFEMLCTLPEPSTVDYSDDGEPVRAGTGVSTRQSQLVEAIQSGCLQFIRDRKTLPRAHRPAPTAEHAARSVAIDLGRLLYLPTRSELGHLDQFQFDFNLGTDRTLQLFDFDRCVSDMRNDGLQYMNAATQRTSYPMELRHADLAWASLLFNQNRFSFGTRLKETSLRTLDVQMLVTRGNEAARVKLTAHATFDGFYQLVFASTEGVEVAVLLGEAFAWLEVHSIQSLDDGAWREAALGSEVWVDGLQHQAGDLFKVDPAALLYVPASRMPSSGTRSFRLVFRPIVQARSDSAAAVVHAAA